MVAHTSLLNRLGCMTIAAPSRKMPQVADILEALPLRFLQVPSVDELLQTKYPVFPFQKTLATAGNEPLMIIHTSGSTGIPKPLIWTHEVGARCMRMVSMDAPDGYDSQDRSLVHGKRMFMTFPPFHVRIPGISVMRAGC